MSEYYFGESWLERFIGPITIGFVLLVIYLIDTDLDFLYQLAIWVMLINLFILLPLSIFKPIRYHSGMLIFYSSQFFGAMIWVICAIIVFSSWSIWWVIIGILLFGVGVIFFGFMTVVIEGVWGSFFIMLAIFIAAFISKSGLFIAMKGNRKL